MAAWASNNHKLNSRTMDENMGALLYQKCGHVDLMQNCDLPPPSKVFPGPDKMVLSSMNKVFSLMGREEERIDFDIYGGGGENEKLELLKALRLSQTRAREAEKKAANLVKEKESVCNVLFKESVELFAHRQWVRFLEVRVSKLQWEIKQQENKWWCSCCRGRSDSELVKEGIDCKERMDGFFCFATLAICLGIGLAFGCGYLF